jgi:hypothetical protein
MVAAAPRGHVDRVLTKTWIVLVLITAIACMLLLASDGAPHV